MKGRGLVKVLSQNLLREVEERHEATGQENRNQYFPARKWENKPIDGDCRWPRLETA